MSATTQNAGNKPSGVESLSRSPHTLTNLKIGFVMHPFEAPPDSVSTHIWVHEVARRLADECSTIVYTARGRSDPEVETRDGVEYRRLRMPSQTRVVRELYRLPILWRLKDSIPQQSSWYYWGHALRTAIDIRAERCDIVHILNLPQFASVIRALNPVAKIVLHMHAGISGYSLHRHLQKIDRVISCSDFFTSQVQRAFPQFASRCATIYNGVDVERFAPNGHAGKRNGGKRLLYVGVVSPHKGLHVLLDALPMVLKRHPEVRLEIIGPPWQLPREFLPIVSDPGDLAGLLRFYDGKPYATHLKEQIAALKLTDSVTFHGLLPHHKLPPYYRQADIFIFPSMCNEAFGMPAAEAMSSGVPVIASRIAGLPEVVEHGKTGVLVEPGNSSALADAIIRLLEDDNLRLSMGRAGRQRVLHNFTWDKIAQDMLEHYTELMAAGKRRQG